MKQKELTEREKMFCRLFASGEGAREAAARAGYGKNSEKTAGTLLERREISAWIKKCAEREANTRAAANGLKKIAFGGISDAVRLLFAESPSDIGNLDAMDLFMVQEIKRPKGGGLEIKFFDRIKALEMLCQLQENSNDDKALPLYKALSDGAKQLKAYKAFPENGI